MRKITAGLFISLDGVVEAPDQWHFPFFHEEMGAAVDATLGAPTRSSSAARPTTASPGRGQGARRPAARTPARPRRSATPARSSCRTRSSSSPMRLFDEGETPIPLRLISSETFQTGVLNLRLQVGRVDRRRHLRGRQGPPGPARPVGRRLAGRSPPGVRRPLRGRRGRPARCRSGPARPPILTPFAPRRLVLFSHD
jgi:hypothetical protein